MSEIFRDRTEGAMARRQDLLRKRRDELVLMPHSIRRVIVARAARAAASLAAITCGVAMIAVAVSPALAKTVASGLPGINPAVISTGVAGAWILALVAFAISRGRAEHRFAVAMSNHVLPGENLDHDIERLSHQRPDRVAREMAHRLEVRSAALPVAAAMFVIPATLVYLARAITVKGWPSTAEYELQLAASAKPLLACALAGIVAAIVMTRAAARRDGVTMIAAFGALLTGALAAGTLVKHEIDMTWVFAGLSVVMSTVALVTWRLTRERKALEIEDPAAGSEMFTLAGMWHSMCDVARGVRRHLSPRLVVGLTAFSIVLVCAGGQMTVGAAVTASKASSQQRSVVQQPKAALAIPGKTSLLRWTQTVDGRIRYDVRFVDGKPLELDEINGIQLLPKGWRGRVTVSLIDAAGLPGAVAVTPFPNTPEVLPLHLGADSPDHRFDTASCDHDTDLGLVITPGEDWPKGEFQASFYVEPAIELASCPADAQ